LHLAGLPNHPWKAPPPPPSYTHTHKIRLVCMHDIMRMVDKEIMKAMLMMHTLHWWENDTPQNNDVCVIILFTAWARRTRGLGWSPNDRQGKRYVSLPVEFHVHILMTRVRTKESVLRMTCGQLERNFDRWWYSTLSIFRYSIFCLFPKGDVARCFGHIIVLYSWEILYILSKHHLDRISHRFRPNVELSSPNLSTSYPRHFKDRFVKWPPGKPR
jgi:hypothetical protein